MSAGRLRVFILTLLAMIAFAGNSILCRMALKSGSIDPASFTSVRIFAGAIVLWLIVRLRPGSHKLLGTWWSGFALFLYAAAFSFAYISLSAGTGALLLFGAVQVTMIGYGLWSGERLQAVQILGLALAAGGLVYLLLPGLAAPPWKGSALMLAAGLAWGFYSLRAAGTVDVTAITAGNFLRAACFAAVVTAIEQHHAHWNRAGLVEAITSGALTSGLGYAIWYLALRELAVSSAASVQLTVPVFAAAGGVLFLGEIMTVRLVGASVAILTGVLLVTIFRQQNKPRIL